jgi:sugar phosphate isomerase/epimerase
MYMADKTLIGRLNKCSVNTATLGHRSTIHAVVDNVARAGFGWIAPWRRDIEGVDLKKLKRQITDAGLRVSSLCRSTYFSAETGEEAAEAVEQNRRALEAASELEAKCFVLVVGGLPNNSRNLSSARQQVFEGISALLTHARRLNVPLALEPLHPMYAADRSCVSTLKQALSMCDAIAPHDAYLGVALDVYHIWWDPEIYEHIVQAGRAGQILGFHLSDWLKNTTDMLLDRGMMGDGVIDLPRLRKAAQQTGFDGPFEVEIFSRDNWWKKDEKIVLKECGQRLQSCC